MTGLNTTAQSILEALKGKKEPQPYDTQATVVRVDGDTLYVHIPGGVDETPVQRTIDAKEGDTVQIRVSGGAAWAVGNVTSPPTDDTAANNVLNRVDNITLRVVGSDGTASEIRLNDQGQINLLGSVLAQAITTEDLMCTNRFEVNNDAWRLVQDDDGCTIATKELNALSQDPVGEFKIGSSYGYISCNHVNEGNVFYRAMVLVNAEIGKVSIECGNAHADFENDAITIGNPEGVLWIMQGKFSVNALNGIEMGHNVYPAEYGTEVSGVYSLGKSTARWSTVYLTSNPNVSSDRNVKRDITEEVPDIIDKLVPVSYKRKTDPDKTHYGFIAQDVEEALNDAGVDTSNIGLVTYDTDSNGTKKNYALAYEELIPLLVAKIQKQQEQIDRLERMVL